MLTIVNKKEKILQIGLQLFAEHGFDAVSTARIAEEAGVSEGLIFKHFKTKAGLLESIYSQVGERIMEIYASLMTESDPERVVLKYLDIVQSIQPEEYPFWKLIFKLKWNDNFYRPEEMLPILQRLAWAMEEMNIPNSALEAELLVHSVENIAISVLRDGLKKNIKLLELLRNKYRLNS